MTKNYNWTIYIQVLQISFFIGILSFSLHLYSQNNNSDFKTLADQFYESEKYFDCIYYYEEILKQKPNDNESRERLAFAQYQTNNLKGAIRNYKYLIETHKNSNPEWVFQLGFCQHRNHQFKDAITTYKKFLRLASQKDPLRRIVYDEIKRCAIGFNLRYLETDAVIENMGEMVNSPFDDFGPIESPNIDSRIYFSSFRNLKVQDNFDTIGQIISTGQERDCDMLATEIVNGVWSKAFPLNDYLTSEKNEILHEFNSTGQIVFFERSVASDDQIFLVDTFSQVSENNQGCGWSPNPFLTEAKQKGLFFFQDSILLFASDRAGGFGGFDIYLTIITEGQWSHPVNLGPQINSPYDEVTPFLTLDGRNLYFSSNNQMSMGGLDVFKAKFNDQIRTWGVIQNLGRPINSAADDLYFRIGRNTLTAYLSSSRSSGYGGLDNYSVYYNIPIAEHLTRSNPILFSKVKSLSEQHLMGVDSPFVKDTPNIDNYPVFAVPGLYFREDDQVLTPQNIATLDKILDLLKTYPDLKLEISSFSEDSGTDIYDLYSSVQRSHKVVDYLVGKGINNENIIVKGFGNNYPVAIRELRGRKNLSEKWYNRRMDLKLSGLNDLPLKIDYTNPKVNEVFRDNSYEKFQKTVEGLSYRIQFLEMNQMYKGDLYNEFADPCIEWQANQKNYRYLSGLFKSFEDALLHLSEIKNRGFKEARILAYLEGRILLSGEIDKQILSSYPDLRNYVLYLN